METLKQTGTIKLLGHEFPLYENLLRVKPIVSVLRTNFTAFKNNVRMVHNSLSSHLVADSFYSVETMFVSLEGVLYFAERSKNKVIAENREALLETLKEKIISVRADMNK